MEQGAREKAKRCSRGAGRGLAAAASGTAAGFVALLAAILLVMIMVLNPVLSVPVFGAQESEDGEEGDSSGLVIEVVEELSIDDEIIIEDEEVPLAMFSEEAEDPGPRHAVMMGIVFCCAAGYVLYFRRYDEKLFVLRREAARAQKRLMDRKYAAGGKEAGQK